MLAADRAPSKRILKEQKDKYWTLRGFGYSMTESCQLAGFSYASAARLEGTARANGDKMVEQRREQYLPNPKTFKELSKDAKKAFDDFEYFQLRYFGRVAIPWQKEAAEKVVDFLATNDREYVVINCPPGSGKTLTFTHDIPAWLTVRNRAIRGMMGSATQRLAERYANRLRRTLERTIPEVASSEDKDKGYATDALSTLAKDFGRFKPMDRDLWTINQFVVMQPRGDATTEKEPTWTAYGADQSYIGGRYDFVIWDDLVDPRKLRTIEAKEDLQETFSDVAESRLEPGGLLVLQGQRISSDDLYRFCLDQSVPEMEDPDTGEMLSSRKKYHHIVFKAHYPEKCKPEHHTKDAEPYPKGCLLSPWRLPWRDISQLMANRAQRFEVLYQQEDVDNASVLVKPDWVYGRSGYPGCIDADRAILEIPKGLSGETFSVASVDPSPTRMWSIQWWVYHPDSEQRFLIDLERRAMEAPEFIDWNQNNRVFTGIMEEWQQTSVALGHPITHWIVEINAAQRFMLQYEHVRRWQALRNVTIIPHATHRNKSDPDYGVQTVGPHWEFGRVRLPWKDAHDTRIKSLRLIDEVTRYPHGRTDDCLMAHWFVEWNLPNIYTPKRHSEPAKRPSWLKKKVA